MTSSPSPPAWPPSVSVVVNTCDRCGPLHTLLHSLRRQTYDRFEVVVIVGPTSDNTLEMLAEEFGDRVRVARCSAFNLSVSRNVGLRQAAGEVVAFIDDDAVPSLTWLEQLADSYSQHPDAVGVGGRTYLVSSEDDDSCVQFLRGRVSVLAEQDDVRWDASAAPPSWTPASFWFPRFHGTNMSYRRAALFELGGFDERFEYLFDDADIAVRFGVAGARLVQLLCGAVYHVPASGRNRGTRSRHDLNWYCWLRSTIFFALKNGSGCLGLRRSLARAVSHTLRFYSVAADLAAKKEIDRPLRRKVRRMLLRGWLEGFGSGIFGRRRLPRRLISEERPFLPFHRSKDSCVAAVPLPGGQCRDPIMVLERPALRIALLSAGYPPASTEGVARSTQMLAHGLAELGHEVHVVTLGEERRCLLRGDVYVHEVRSVPRRRYAALGCDDPTVAEWLDFSHAVYEQVRELIVDHRIQVVDTPLWNLDGLVTAIAGELPVVVRVVTAMKQIADFAHGEVPAGHRLLGDLETELLGRAAAVVSNSGATAETLRRVYGFDTDDRQHRIVHYGIEPVEESELAPDPAAGTEETTVTVLFVGRLESRKGVLDLFDAIPRVLSEHPQVRFLIAGPDNSVHDGFAATHGSDYPSWFAKRHRDLGHRVEFLGYVPEDELSRLYRDCDLLVAPSLYESFGLIYLEAMNYARPVIGCRAGGPNEIIEDGRTGRLVPPQDGVALAQAISELVDLGPARREFGRKGRALLLQRFTHRNMAEGFAKVYRDLVDGRQAEQDRRETDPT